MADLLTHALVAFSIGTALSWKFKRITPQFITIMMIGSVLPDLNRIELLLDPAAIQNTLDIPFSWQPFHTLGGVLLIIGILTLLVSKKNSELIFSLLCIGAFTHFLLDIFLLNASGTTFIIFFPITTFRPEMQGFYLSTDVWPAIVAAYTAIIVWFLDLR